MRTKFSAYLRTAQTILLTSIVLISAMTLFVSCEDGMEDIPTTVTPVDPKPGTDPAKNLKLEDSSLELNYEAEAALYHAVAADSLITTVRLMHLEDEVVVLDTVYKKNPWFDVDVKAKEEKEILVSSLSALKVTSPLALTASDPTVMNVDGFYDRKIVYTGTFTIGTDEGEKSQYEVSIENEDFSKFFSAEKAVLQLSHAPFVAGDILVLGENKEMKRDSVTVDGKKFYLVPMDLVFKSYRNKVDASTAVTTKSAESFLMEQGRSTASATTKSTRSGVISDYVHDAPFTAIVKVAAENGGGVLPEQEELLNYNNVRSSYVILPNSSNVTGKVRSTTILNTQWRVAADRDSTFTMLENYSGVQPSDVHIVLEAGKSASLTDKNRSSYPSNNESGNRVYHQLKNWYTFKVDGKTYEGDYYFNWVSGYFTIVTAANKPNGDKIWFKTPSATMVDNATYNLVSSNVDVTVDGKNYKRTTYREVVSVVFGGENGTENITMGRNIVIDVLQKEEPKPEDDLVKTPILKGKYAVIEGSNIKYYNVYEIERALSGKKDTTVVALKPFSFEKPNGEIFYKDAFGYTYSTTNKNETVNGLEHKLTTNYLFKLADGTTVTRTYVVNFSLGGSFTLFAGTEFALTDSFKEVSATQTFGGITPSSETPSGNYVEVSYTVKNNIVLINNFSNGHTDVVRVEDYVHPTKGRYIGHRGRTLSICNYQSAYLWTVDLEEWENGLEIFADGNSKEFWKKEDLNPAEYDKYVSATSKGPNNRWYPAQVRTFTSSNKGYWEWYATSKDGSATYASPYAYKSKDSQGNSYDSGDWAINATVVKANGAVTITSPGRPTTTFNLR